MAWRKLLAASLLIAFSIPALFTCTALQGQETQAILRADAKNDTDFEVSTGIGLSLNGPTYFYEFRLADENGFEYDTWSIARNPEVVEHAGLSKEQVKEMSAIREATRDELIKSFTKLATTNKGKAEMEQQFRESELEMRAVMDDEQLARFEHVQNQLNIQQVGFAKFLTTKAIRESLELSQSEVDQLSSSADKLEAKIKSGLKDVFLKANLELLERLSEKQLAEFDKLVAESNKNEFLDTRLVNSNVSTSKLRKLDAPDFLRSIVRSKTTRDKIELTESQLEKIKALRTKRDDLTEPEARSKVEAELKQVLSQDQYRKLLAIAIQKESARWGTVVALSGGSLSRELGFTEADSKQVFAAGIKIQKEMKERVQDARLEIWKEIVSDLSPASQEKILSVVGTPMVFDFE